METVVVNGEEIQARRVNMSERYKKAFETAKFYRKNAVVYARQVTKRELIYTSQDGMENYAEPGHWIVYNPGDKDPYVFGDKSKTLEQRNIDFSKKYEAIPGESGKFRAKGIIKAVQVDENIVFDTAWGETMVVEKGGWVADGGYGIAKESFNNTYEEIENPQG